MGALTEPLSVASMADGFSQPGMGTDGLLSSDPGPCPFQQLGEPPTVSLPQQPRSPASSAEFPSATAAPEPGASPRLAVDLALPEGLPLVSSHAGLSGGPVEPVALSVTEFGLIGIGGVNPFLTGRPVCPASTLRSEPLSQCNVMTC